MLWYIVIKHTQIGSEFLILFSIIIHQFDTGDSPHLRGGKNFDMQEKPCLGSNNNNTFYSLAPFKTPEDTLQYIIYNHKYNSKLKPKVKIKWGDID